MADHNVNINVRDLSKGAAGAPRPTQKTTVALEPASIQKLSKAYQDVVSKTSLDEKKLGGAIADAVSRKIGTNLPKGGEISKADLGRIINNMANELARKINKSQADVLSKLSSPTAPGGSDKKVLDGLSNINNQIKDSIGKLNTQLQREFGKKVGPETSKAMAFAVSGAVERAIPKSLGKVGQDFSKAVSSVQSIAKEIANTATSIRKLRKSGGGIDITEIKSVVSSVKKLTTEFAKLPGAIKQARDSAKVISKEQKDTYDNFSRALTDLRKSVREQVTGVKRRAAEDPQKFARTVAAEISKVVKGAPALKGTQIEKVLGDLDKKVGGIGEVGKAFKDVEKELKTQIKGGKLSVAGLDSLLKTIDTLNSNLKNLPKTIGAPDEVEFKGLEAFSKRTERFIRSLEKFSVDIDVKQIPKLTETVSKQVKEGIEKGVKDAKIELEVDTTKMSKDLKTSLDKLMDDISKKAIKLGVEPGTGIFKQIEQAKKTLVGGKPGEIRTALFELKKLPELKGFSDALQKGTEDLAYLSGLKEAASAAKRFADKMDSTTKTLSAVEGAAKRLHAAPVRSAKEALKTYMYEYPTKPIRPGVKLEAPAEKAEIALGERSRKMVAENVAALQKSLEGLQKFMVEKLEQELKSSGRGWEIVRKDSKQAIGDYFKIATGGMTGNIKEAGKQWAIQIADIAGMKGKLGGALTKYQTEKGSPATPKEIVKAYKGRLVEKITGATKPITYPQRIAKWIKLTSEESIKSLEDLTSAQKDTFLSLKKEYKGVEVASEMENAIKTLLGTEKEIERVFRKTSASIEAEKIMREGILEKDKRKKRVYEEPPVLRTLAVPAAKLTTTGAAAFETAAGSMRALPKFATFMTGFERIYDMLLEAKKLRPGETFGTRIREVGPRPAGAGLFAAENLAKEMIKALSMVQEKRALILEQYQRAAVPRGLELEKAGAGSIGELEKQVEGAIDAFRKLPEAERNIDTFMDAMDKVGISAYDVVKSLDELRFENVYDVLKKILAKPITGVAQAPIWGKPMRQFEETVRQLQQLLPLIEPGKPRRGAHMEAIAQVLTRTRPAYAGAGLRMEERKEFIKDINLRLGEMVAESRKLREREGEGVAKRLAQLKIPEAVREMSTLGVPEALAGKIQELRPGRAKGMESLEELGATTLKMYTENLRELSPFGSQFQNWSRNITNVSNAMSSASDETIRKLNEFGAAVKGAGTEFPTLRTERERELISGGRYGGRGYGFNVLAELRTTAGTFEDQVLISGKIADAITSITKTLVRPGVAGRLREYEKTTAVGVTEVEPKLLRDVSKSVSDASDKIQEVLGMPERYKGRADRALIQEVSKAITVVRGREVEVQAAKLAEVFLNYFGRKITTRFGQKGVGVTPVPQNLQEVLQYYGEKPIKVLPKAERTRAGLGVAVMPKTMGQLAAEILEKEADKLETAGVSPAQIKDLTTSLVNSGNRFMIDMFKEAGVLAEDEIKVEKGVFTKLRNALAKLDIDLASDIEGIKGLKGAYKERVGKPLFEERPIDVRISAYGVGKRGLQTEVLESVMSNVMGLRPGTKRPATMKPELKPEVYQKMLGVPGTMEPGMLSKYAKALGFEPAMAGKREDVYKQLVDEFTKTFGKGKEEIAKRAAELEALSNFYVEVIDELSRGKKPPRKGLVGPKFVQIVEEPTFHADWTKTEVEKGVRGEKLNLPAFGAYSAIFGEQSEFMKELKGAMTIDSREAWEYLKALQVVNKQSDEFKKLLMTPLKTVDLFNIKDFTEATGTMEDFKDTVLDIQKFPGPFKVKIPATEKGAPGKYEEMYMPGPLARGTYEEPLIAGERAPKLVARRLTHLISMAKKVEQERTGFAEIEKEITNLESALEKTEDASEIISLNEKLETLNKELEKLYADPGNVEKIKTQIAKNVGNMVKRINELAKSRTGESEITSIINTLMGALSKTVAPQPGLRTRYVGAEFPEITHAQKFMEEQLRTKKSPFEAYVAVGGRLSDMLIGVSDSSKQYLTQLEETLADLERGQKTPRLEKFAKSIGAEVGTKKVEDTLRKYVKTHQDRAKALTVLQRSAEGGGLATLAQNLGVMVGKEDSDYEKALGALSRAKIDYYNTLAEVALGKTGAVAEILFSRKIPAVMGKAVSATVDKTDDLKRFTEDLRKIYAQFADLGDKFNLGELETVANEILSVREEHAKNVERYKKLGLPVLKQHELGIPPEMAKKIPIKYTPKYRMAGKGIEEIPEAMQKEVQSTLFDILEESEKLTKGGFIAKPGGPKPPSRRELQDYVEKQLVPYIESVRFPFTGISSVQPYKAKLMHGGLAKAAMAVPGMPEMDIEKFDELKDKVVEIKKALEGAREGLQDTTDDLEKRKTLTAAIDELNRAISRVLPKYAAHEQKLDFDGDNIEIHAAVTRDARKEIKQHFDALSDDIDSTRSVFRDFFTYEARQMPTKEYPLAEMAKAYAKKFPVEKGFEFLKKPYLEKEAEYIKPQEALRILAERPGAASPADILKDITQQMVRKPEEQKQALEAIDASVNKEADALVNAVLSLGGNIEKLVKEGIKTRSFEEKYKDAIEAQLYKIHTGPETEALYRLVRLVEMNIGFGGGMIKPGAPSRATEEFKKRWPRTKALGGKPEYEFQTMINELLRFGVQKGMDVKHAGEFPVAGEVVRELGKGEKAAENLFDRITVKNEEAFKDLKDFAEQNAEAIERRLGRLSTRELRVEATKLREARGVPVGTEVEELKRPALVKEIVERAGFKGFLIELSRQIRETAGVGPGEKINIREQVIAKRQPLYMKRVWGAAPGEELAKYGEEKIPTPEFAFAGMNKAKQKAYIRKYKEAQATAMNLAKELKTATETMGGGAYAQMVSSSIENIYEEQKQINDKLLSKLQEPAGFAANIPETPLVKRVLEGADVANITKDIIGDPREVAPEFIKQMKNQMEEFSNLVGVSLLTKGEKFAIKEQVLEDFGKRVSGVLGKTEGVSPEEIERYSYAWFEKAKAIAQMDKVIDALKSKRYEASIVRTLLPSPEDIKKVTKEAIRFRPEPKMPTAAEREATVRRYMPGAEARAAMAVEKTMAATKGAAGRAFLPRGAKECVPITNCGKPLDVYIVGAAGGIMFSDVGQEKGLTGALKQQIKETGPASSLAKQAEYLREMAVQATGELNKLSGTTYKDVYRASGLMGGGAYEQRAGVFKPAGVDIDKLRKSQMQAVMKQMLGLVEETPQLEASALLGQALHSKIGRELKKKHGENIELEKFVKYDDEIAGTIGGHVDAAIKNAAGGIEKIIDIKTVGAGILSDIGEGVIDLNDATDKATNKYTKLKLKETASQINLYLAAAAKASGQKPEEIIGEARFYSRLEPERKPAIVRMKFDPEKLKDDLEAVRKSRELIQKYIIEDNPLELADVEYRKIIDDLKAKLGGKKPAFAPSASLKEMEEAPKSIKEFTDEQIAEFVKSATEYYKRVTGKKAATMPATEAFTGRPFEEREKVRIEKEIREAAKSKMDMAGFEKAAEIPPAGDLESVFKALVALHTQAKNYQSMINKLDFENEFKGLHKTIQDVFKEVKEKGRAGGAGSKLVDIMKDLQEEGAISQEQTNKIWKMYRMAVGDFYLKEAAAAKKMAGEAGDDIVAANAAYAKFRGNVERLQEFIIESLPKRTGIYTAGTQYVSPELARAAKVYLEPKELAKRAGGAIGEDEQLRQLFKMVVETEKAPVFKAREIVSSLTNMSDGLIKLLSNADLVKRKGEEFQNAWNFDALTEGATRLRTALQSYLRFNVRDDFTAAQRKNLQDVLVYLKQIETGFAKFGGAARGKWGETGVVKVMPWLDPEAQRALHMRNVASVREYYKKAEAAGGPQVGERFTYIMKVLDQTGNVVRNTAFDFNKYGEYVNKAGEASSAFAEKQRDLMEFTQGANRTFRAALRRVTMWGAAATIVYGGISKLKQVIGTLADIETGVAQLRMVMSPLETDFGALQNSAVQFAKQYGTATTDVLKGMRIFAQQGLKQAEVIDRTRTATLAANVTTLNAKDATEAITAASKVFRQEGESTVKFIDAWSEVEAKHAITSADLALALRKAASAGKNAGFTFDELNGIIASIGAVTRQTGREVGTSLRFIFRRLSSEKGPKELAKIGVPVMTGTGELRKGFDILHDLSLAWKDLTSAQKMNIAQAVGGTRQYNQVLVLMDNWNEALSATRDSINSVGSAQRKNQEIMKTYTKQSQQTRAAAVELQMAFGKAYLPIAKFGLKGTRFLLESLNAIPNSVKAVATGLALLITYIAKGDSIVNAFTSSLTKGGALISEFFGAFKKGLKIAGYEVFGAGKGIEFEGLKKITEGKSIRDFQSALGKTAYVVSEIGKSWNKMIGDMVVGSGSAARSVGKAFAKVGEGIQAISPVRGIAGIMAAPGKAGLTPTTIKDMLRKGGFAGLAQIGKASLGVAGMVTAAAAGGATELVGDAIDMFGKGLGTAGQKFLKNFAAQNTGLVKATAPLILSFAALTPVMKSVLSYYGNITKSARDYEESVYGSRRANETELNTLRGLIKEYDTLSDRLEDAKKAAAPEVKARRMELGTYESPLLALAGIQKDAADTANVLAENNISLVVGYDKLGNAVLRTVGNFKEYLKQLEKLKVKEMAKTEVDVLAKYIKDLTQIEGPEKWKYELKKLLKEAPVFGEIIGKHIKIAPAKALHEVTKRLNELIALKNKFPISKAFDKDIKSYQNTLKEVRTGFDQTYRDFKRVLSELPTAGLDKKDISELLGREELRKGYEVMLEIEPRFQIKGVKGNVKWEDVLGAEVLKRVFPEAAPVIDVSSLLTEARLETAGFKPRIGKAMSGDIVTFWDEVAQKYNIAGNQAVVSLKETTDGVFEWIVTYFNTKTLKVEERPFSEDMRKLVDNVFPLKAIQEDLSDRLDAFDEFVAGASAGLRGVGAKAFKKQFGLGERFFAEIPTTTLLQGPKGYMPGPGGGKFGVSPLQKQWAETIDEFFFKPMTEYRTRMEQLGKLRLGGLEGSEQITVATGMYEELVKLQEVLKNNQVVLQYRAVLVDLTKTMEQSVRTMRENLAVEKDRLKLEQGVGGYLKGVPEGLENINLGVQRFRDLTARQRALIEEPRFRAGAAGFREAEIRRGRVREDVYAVDRALVAIESIKEVAAGFGAAMEPADLAKYTELVAKTGETGTAEIVLETKRVEKNTADTVGRLDKILENMGDEAAIEDMLSSVTDYIGFGLRNSQKTVNALERVARVREKYRGAGNDEVVMASNKALDVLTQNLVQQVGIKKAMEMVEDNTTVFSKKFTPEELAQRAFGGMDFKAFYDKMSSISKDEKRWSWRQMDYISKPSFESLDETKKLVDLQNQSVDTGLFSSKNLIKSTAAIAAFEQFNKKHSSDVIKSLEGQKTNTMGQLQEAEAQGKDTSALVSKIEALDVSIKEEKKKLDVQKLVQATSIVSASLMEFSKAVGMTENQIKVLGGGAAATLIAFNLVSRLMGEELPKSANEFKNALMEAAKTYAVEGGGPAAAVKGAQARMAGKAFYDEFKKRAQEVKGGEYQTGGLINGPGGPKDDRILIGASKGEYVVNADKSKQIGYDILDYINKYGKLPETKKYPSGGAVSPKEFLYGKNWKEKLKSSALMALTYPLGPEIWPWIKGRKGKLPTGTKIKETLLGGFLGPFRPWMPFQVGGIVAPKKKSPYELGEPERKQPLYVMGGPRDIIPIRVSDGEYIISSDKAKKVGYDILDYINKEGKLPGFQAGGVVGGAPAAGPRAGTAEVDLSPQSINRLKQALLSYVVATGAGYVAGKSDAKTRLATLNALAEDQAKLFADIVEKYPEEAEKIIKEMRTNVQDMQAEGKRAKVETELKSMVLNTEKERLKVVKNIEKIRESLIEEHEKITREMEKTAERLANIEMAKQFKMELEEMENAVDALDIADKVREKLSSALLEFDWKEEFVDKIKFPVGAGLFAGKYRPQPVELGPRSLAQLTPEEYMVATNREIAYKPTGGLLKPLKALFRGDFADLFEGLDDVVTGIREVDPKRFGKAFEEVGTLTKKKPAEEFFKGLEKMEKEHAIKKSKLEEYETKKAVLEKGRGFFGLGLSKAEEKEYQRLVDVTDDLTNELTDLTEDIARAKERLAPERAKAEIEMIGRVRERELAVAKAIEKAAEKFKVGRGILAGMPAIPTKEIEFGPRTIRELTPYQVAKRQAMMKVPGFKEGIKDLDKYAGALEEQQSVLNYIGTLEGKLTEARIDEVETGQKQTDRIEALEEALKKAKKELESVNDTLKDTSVNARETSKAAEQLQRVREREVNIVKTLMHMDLEAYFGNIPTTLNRQLRGFSGEPSLPPTEFEMTPAQIMFSRGGGMADLLKTYTSGTRVLGELASEITKVTDLRLGELETLVDFGSKNKENREVMDQVLNETHRLTNEQKDLIKSYLDLYNVLEKVAPSIKNTRDFTEMWKSSMDALRAARVKERVEAYPEVTRGRELAAMLPGGGHPLARVPTTPAQRRMGAMVGMNLRPFEVTAFDLKKAQDYHDLLTTNLEPQAAMDKIQSILDMPTEQKDAVEAWRKQIEYTRVREEQARYQERLHNMEMFKATHNLEGAQAEAVDSGIEGYRNAVQQINTYMERIMMKPSLLTGEGVTRAFEDIRGGEEDVWTKAQAAMEAGTLAKTKEALEGVFGPRADLTNHYLRALLEKSGLSIDKLAELDPDLKALLEATQKLADERAKKEATGKEAEVAPAVAERGALGSAWDWLMAFKKKQNAYFGLDRGGNIAGPGGPREDKVPIWASPGEYVIRQAAARRIGYDTLGYMNEKGVIPGMQDGGIIDLLFGKATDLATMSRRGMDYKNIDVKPHLPKFLTDLYKKAESKIVGLNFAEMAERTRPWLVDMPKEERLKLVEKAPEEKNLLMKALNIGGKQFGLAATEFIGRRIQNALDLAAMAESLGRGTGKLAGPGGKETAIQIAGMVGAAGKAVWDRPEILGELGEKAYEAAKADILTGGGGTLDVLMGMVGGPVALAGAAKIGGKGLGKAVIEAGKLSKAAIEAGKLSKVAGKQIVESTYKDLAIQAGKKLPELSIEDVGLLNVLNVKRNLKEFVREYRESPISKLSKLEISRDPEKLKLGEAYYQGAGRKIWMSPETEKATVPHEMVHSEFKDLTDSLKLAEELEIEHGVERSPSLVKLKTVFEVQQKKAAAEREIARDLFQSKLRKFLYNKPIVFSDAGEYSRLMTESPFLMHGVFNLSGAKEYSSSLYGLFGHEIFSTASEEVFKRAMPKSKFGARYLEIKKAINEAAPDLEKLAKFLPTSPSTEALFGGAYSEFKVGRKLPTAEKFGHLDWARKLLESTSFKVGAETHPHLPSYNILHSKHTEEILSKIPRGSKIFSTVGEESVILETPKGTLLRIGETVAERPKVPGMLQAKSRKVFGNLQMEEVQKVKTKGMTQNDANTLREQLRKYNVDFWDAHPGNVGKVEKTGELVVTDAGAVRGWKAPVMKGPFSKDFKWREDITPEILGARLKEILGGYAGGGRIRKNRYDEGGMIDWVKEKYKAAKEATKASLGEASRSFFGVRKEEEGMMEELFPGEPTRAQGYQDGGRPFTKDFEYGRKKPLTKKQIEGIISRYAEKQLGLVEELPEVEKIEKPKAVLSKYGVSTIKPFSKPWEMLKKKLGNEIDDQVNLWKTRQLLESGVVKSEEEKENLRKYISQGDRLIGGVARGEFRSIDVDVDKEYGKFRMMGKMYGNLRDVAFRKEIERRFGADWHKKFYPNLPPDPESLAIQYEALKNAYPHLTVPMSLAKTIDELPGTDQLPSYDGGGRVAQTGPAFVHEGEWIVPKKFADGGAVGPATFDKNVLKGSSLDIDWDEIKTTIETAIKDAIESAEFPKLEVTDDLPMLDVDVADKKVGVETAGVEVSLNAAEAIAGIEAALKNVNVGAGGAVGAERLDKVDLAVDTLTNRIFDLEDTVDRKIKQEMEMLNGSVVSREVINEIIQTKIDPLRTEINSSYSIGDGYRRDIENLKEHIGTRIEMLEAQLNRVTTHVGGA